MCYSLSEEEAKFVPDYKKMYLTLFNATEEAVNLLITAQRECEELYISSEESETAPLPTENGNTP